MLPFFHIYGQTVVMNVGLRPGGDDRHAAALRPRAVPADVEHHRITRAFVVPPIILALAKHPLVDGFDRSSLEMVISGAAPLDAALRAPARARSECGIQGYGLTEASPVTHCTPLDEPHQPGSIGKLLPNTEARIVDVETGPTSRPACRRDPGSADRR